MSTTKDEEQSPDDIWDAAEAADSGATPPPEVEADDDHRDDDSDAIAATAAAEDQTGADDPADDEPPAAEDDDEDLWANVDPKVRAAYEKAMEERKTLEQSLKSVNGRVAAYQRRYEEAAQRLAAQTTPPADDDEEDDEETANLLAEYPEVAKPILDRQKKLEKSLKDLREADQRRQTDQATAQYGKLDALHPGFADLLDENQAAYQAWLARQDDDIRHKAARNEAAIVDATEAADVVGRFKTFLERVEGALNEPAGNTSAPPTPARDSKRERQLRGSATAPSLPQSGSRSGVSRNADPAVIWDELERQEQAQRSQAHR